VSHGGIQVLLPPFHEDLGLDGHLYTLAVVAGRYLHRNSGGSEAAHFVLRWSPSPDLSPFSLGSVAADGRYLSYHRLVDGLDTPEFALLRAAGGEGVPAHCWRLYPPTALPEGEFAAAGHRAGYFAARRRLAAVLYQTRGWAALGAGLEDHVLFRPDDPTGAGRPSEAAPDAAELFLAALEESQKLTAPPNFQSRRSTPTTGDDSGDL
jgi:hypothetical protein